LFTFQAKAAALRLESTLQKVIDTVASFKVAGESNMKLDTAKMTVTVDKKMTININEGKYAQVFYHSDFRHLGINR